MATTLPDELANLPPPELIEELDYEARLALFITRLVTLMSAAGIDYDVDELEGDPAKILLEVSTYIDQNLRARINEAMRANLLPYAYGGDLDILGQFYDTPRLDGEDDENYRDRIILGIRGRSPGGTEARYRAVARAAHINVADAAVYTVGKDPTVHIAIFSKINGGVADQELIDAVNTAVQRSDVRLVNDTIVVHAAAQQVTNITADVWLLPETSTTILTAMEAALRSAWESDGALGRDLTRSYLISKLMLDGVQDVNPTSPSGTVVAEFNRSIALGTITLTNRGREY